VIGYVPCLQTTRGLNQHAKTPIYNKSMLFVTVMLLFAIMGVMEVEGFGLQVPIVVGRRNVGTSAKKKRKVVVGLGYILCKKKKKEFGMLLRAMMEEEEEDDHSCEDEDDIASDFGEENVGEGGVMIEDLNWRVEKLRLEEANKRRFLKAKPVFLPYKDCSRWVQAWGQRWTTAKDWYVDLIFIESVRLEHNMYYPTYSISHGRCFLFYFCLRTGKIGFPWERNETRISHLGRMNITVGEGIGSLG
jgi:hypothetical protein